MAVVASGPGFWGRHFNRRSAVMSAAYRMFQVLDTRYMGDGGLR